MAVPSWLSALGHVSSDVFGVIFGEELRATWRKKTADRLDDTCRKTFALMVSRMPEPWRTKMNEHYRKASKAHIENKMARLLVKAVEGCTKPEEKLEYFQYVSMLDWDKPRKDDATGDVYPSVLEELDKLDHDPIPEFFEWGLEKLNEVAKNSIPKAEPRIERIRVPVRSLAERIQKRTEELQKGGRKSWIF